MEANELKQLVKESLREVLREERLTLCQILIPFVSDPEMQEIQSQIGEPADYAPTEFVDLTDWVKHGNPLQ
jgi:hypothetical protein